MCISVIENVRSSLTHLHGFQLLVLLSIVFSTGKSAIPPLFNGLEVLSSASDKAKLFAENFSKNSVILMTLGSLYLFSLLELI